MTDEAGEVRVITEWLDWHGIGYLPIPNRGRWSQDIRRPGAPDMVLIDRAVDPSEPGAYPRPVAIEVKRAKGGKVSKAQQEVHSEMRRKGWIVLVGAAPDVLAESGRLRWCAAATPGTEPLRRY